MNEQIPQTKEMIVENIVECIKVESYPTDANKGFMKANITDIVLLIVLHILRAFQFGTSPSHNLSLQKMSEIITRDCKMGGSQEYLGIDLIGTSNWKFIFVVEAKRLTVGQVNRQCFLALNDFGDNNGHGIVYSLITNRDQWEVIRYDGTTFT